MDTVKFTQMKDGDEEDYAFLVTHEKAYAAGCGARILDAMAHLDDGLSGYKVTRLGHSLQTATRAWRDGADADWVVAALLHDLGDLYAPYNHDEYAATMLKPYVREQCVWTVGVHGAFQKIYYADKIGADAEVRETYRTNPYFDDCAAFCERWDQASFDPGYETLPLTFFRPIVLNVFLRKPYDPAVVRPGAREPLIDPAVAAARAKRSTHPAPS